MRHLCLPALLLSSALLSSCVQPKAVEIAPLMEKVADVETDLDAAMYAAAEVNTDLEAQLAQIKSEVGDISATIGDIRTTIGGTNDNITTWLGMLSGPVCLMYYIGVHRPIRRRINGKQ